MSEVLMGFVGDVLVNRDDPREVFSEVGEILRAPRILFANLEGAYADDPDASRGVLQTVHSPACNLDVYADAGFNVMSLANNHILDAGHATLLGNRTRLRARGVKTCGAGDCLADARQPAILRAGDLSVAFLAYASTFPEGHEAQANRPGLVPMRAYDVWRQPFPRVHTPGMRPLAATTPDQTDLAALTEDIRQARARADLVIASFHWGDHTRPFYLTDHEVSTARYCIDRGAHMVIGHHHHALRGMEWYAGKPILYGLGHFVFDLPSQKVKQPGELSPDQQRYLHQIQYDVGPREGWPLLPMPEDARLTVLAWATAQRGGIDRVGFLPCHITPDGRVHPLRLNSPKSNEVVSYLEQCNLTQGLRGRIVTEGAVEIAGFQTLCVV